MIPVAKMNTRSLADTVSFELIGHEMGQDVKSSLNEALAGEAVFPGARSALGIFRHTLASSIREIESHPKGRLLQNFVRKGPYEGDADIPLELVDLRLSDSEAAAAITFIYSFMVNSFKGAVAEMLAVRPCLRLLKRLQNIGALPPNARLYVGDSVMIPRKTGNGVAKAADLHILAEDRMPMTIACVSVFGVAEVKSYVPSRLRLRDQINLHLRRARQGMRIGKVDYSEKQVTSGIGKIHRPVRIAIIPSDWKLSRSFRFEKSSGGSVLHVDQSEPPNADDDIVKCGQHEWRITLRWSKEAIAQAAYEMTFWYMEKVGEVIYGHSLPEEWSEMSAAEAGRNAAKMMLYYAILRCRSAPEAQRAIALYNCYGYGYALGMNFKNLDGRREMLWPEDLDELLQNGKTKHGCSLT